MNNHWPYVLIQVSRDNEQLVRFILVGIATTLIHFLILSLCFVVLETTISVATLIAFSVAVLFSYSASYGFTFKSNVRHIKSVPKFAVTVILGLMWNMGVMVTMVEVLLLPYWLAFLSATFLVMLNNFLLSKYWVYAE